jgi:hypothetical protein
VQAMQMQLPMSLLKPDLPKTSSSLLLPLVYFVGFVVLVNQVKRSCCTTGKVNVVFLPLVVTT